MTTVPSRVARTWEAELARLETDVAAAEALLADGETAGSNVTDDWTPPTDLGPLPEAMLVRAQAVLQRQQRVAEALRSARAANTRQRDFTARVTGATVNRATPAYLDVTA